MKPINIDENCQFLKDLDNKNGYAVNKGLYNLMIMKGQVKLFCGGIKPTKNWTLKSVKEYFGLFDTNGKENILNVLNLLDKELKK